MNIPAPPVPRPIARRSGHEDGLDFDALKAEGIALAQRYSGSHWTDYNEHDPGVTILEQLCFAITELGYRAGFPIEDLLAGRDSVVLRRPAEMLPTEPVTEADYRRLLIDRVPELGNAWLSPSGRGPRGVCDIALYVAPEMPGLVEPPDEAVAARVAARARRVYLRHRALGEDVGSVSVLRPARARVAGQAVIDPAARPETVMAQILYRLGMLMAPEPRRMSVVALAAEGVSAPDLLEGPMLANGLIGALELTARRRRIEASELDRHVSAVPGVLAVADLRIELENGDGIAAEVSEDECFALDAGFDGPFPLALTVHGHVQPVDAVEVRRLLKRRWTEHRRRFRTASELRRSFEAPRGRQRDLSSYQPVSLHFPALYGVGPQGLPSDPTTERESLARQLLGYLALFDRIMVDYLDRLANLPAILGGAEVDPSLFERRLADAIPSLAPLLVDGGPDADSLLGRAAFPVGQQERVLDFLLALQGENPDPLIPRRPRRSGELETPGRNASIKRSLLRHVVELGRRRSSGFDYAAKRSRRNVSGLELRSRLMLGTEVEPVKRRRPRIAVIEHILLRPRAGDSSRCDREMRITALVHAGDGSARDDAWRSQVVEMVRANTPAHLAVATYFLDRAGWIRFKRLHRLWRSALRNGFTEASEMLSHELRGLIASLEEGGRE